MLEAKIKFDDRELREITRRMSRLETRIARKEARTAVLIASRMIAKTAKEILETHRQSGALIKSIRVSAFSATRIGQTIGRITNVDKTFYGNFLEFGTSRQAGIHWLSQSLVLNQKRVVPRMAQHLKTRLAVLGV